MGEEGGGEREEGREEEGGERDRGIRYRERVSLSNGDNVDRTPDESIENNLDIESSVIR